MASSVSICLKSEWIKLTSFASSDRMICDGFFEKLLEAYSEPHRVYHRVEHLQHVIGLLNEARISEAAVFWSSFFHDYVYIPGKNDNEVKSAYVAANQLKCMGIEQGVIDRVFQLIVATKKHELITSDYAGSAFLDADMAILGMPKEHYIRYAKAVRQEFVRVPEFLFARGRKFFLEDLLAKQCIFLTDWFYSRFEIQARKNIMEEIYLLNY